MIKPKKPTVEQRLASIEKWITWRMRCAIAVEERIRDLTTAFHEHMDKKHAAPAVEKKGEVKIYRVDVRDVYSREIGWVGCFASGAMAREYADWLNKEGK
mgnify:CR=1 FL=1